jgi:hypothetical protein
MKYIWLSGSEEEIEELKEAFRANGFSFSQGEHFEISNSPFGPGRFSSSLKDFQAPATPTPQPRPWDAVLGGKR